MVKLSTFALLVALAISSCATPPSNLSTEEQEGERLFAQACASCHTTSGDTAIVGPPLAGIATAAGTRVAGMSAHDYLLQSIVEPSAFVNEGYQDIMPQTFAQAFDVEQLEALVAYLLTLH